MMHIIHGISWFIEMESLKKQFKKSKSLWIYRKYLIYLPAQIGTHKHVLANKVIVYYCQHDLFSI